MIVVVQVAMWLCTLAGVALLIAAIPGRAPRTLVFGLAGLAQAFVFLGMIADVIILAGGHQTPDLVTHISYVLSVPWFIPIAVALTYRKLDRGGLIMIGVGCLVTASLVLRQIQTLGVIGG